MSDAANTMTEALATAQAVKAAKPRKSNAPANLSPARVQQFKAAEARTKANQAPTLADILRLVPSDDQMGLIVAAFAVEAGDVDELTGAGSSMIRDQYELLSPVLVSEFRGESNYHGLKMHLDRMVDSLVRSAYGAANFYENRRQIAKDAASAHANEHRDEDRMGIDGGANKVDGQRRFAAESGAKAYALSCIASGACAAYKELMGEDWKPYQSLTNLRSVSDGAAAAQAAALGF